MRRLLSLDYVLEHTGLSWLPAEAVKVLALQVALHRSALGAQRTATSGGRYGTPGSGSRLSPLRGGGGS